MGILEDLMKVLIVFIVVGLPITFIFGQPMIKRLLEHREKRMEIEARLTAERRRNMRRRPSGSSSGCGCSNGS